MISSETWVVMLSILRTMGSLHNHKTQQISGRMPLSLNNEGWDYPTIGEELADAGLETIGVYVDIWFGGGGESET